MGNFSSTKTDKPGKQADETKEKTVRWEKGYMDHKTTEKSIQP